jgi:E3 ubiquitin-protein ligase NEDD4
MSPAVDVDDWAKFTDYRGYSTDDQVIKWFWQCIRSWPPERKSRLLQFVTGTSRLVYPLFGANKSLTPRV